MAYENYEKTLDKDLFFKRVGKDVAGVTQDILDHIYEKYVLKAGVFQRDNFTCQNRSGKGQKCPCCHNTYKYSKLTFHHVKFRKNNGEDKERNGVTLCTESHAAFHKASLELVFLPTATNLPAHIRGHRFKLHKSEEKDWKKIKFEMKQLRKELKRQGFKPVWSWDQIALLMRWIFGDRED
jgi:hypothetical protein